MYIGDHMYVRGDQEINTRMCFSAWNPLPKLLFASVSCSIDTRRMVPCFLANRE